MEKSKKKKEIFKEFFKDQELQPEIFDDYTKEPCKILSGHTRAIRELAYSKIHKINVSVGFDFTIYVWNPYLENYIIKLDEHENPLVGVNCLPALGQFVTADAKGVVKVWNIKDYSCIQTF